TVALSGDGGDECFAGYSRHVLTARLARLLRAPPIFRRTAATTLRLLAGDASDKMADAPFVPNDLRRLLRGDRLRRLTDLLAA
ncbi:asparagine synthase-related protein, partial [Klebsiella pneumoniae]|uniref:asparagine synthase-related protein n=1 Tax=Klebsiella pneumoniae TaxID=573 RepID=UPI001954F280